MRKLDTIPSTASGLEVQPRPEPTDSLETRTRRDNTGAKLAQLSFLQGPDVAAARVGSPEQRALFAALQRELDDGAGYHSY